MTPTEQKLAWRKANPEKDKANRKAHYERHREEVKAKRRAMRAANAEKLNAQKRAHYAANREKMLARQKEWKARNPESRKNTYLKGLYGITLAQYDALAVKCGGVCEVCKGPGGKKGLCVDHDHATGAVRGLLCDRCNIALGMLDDMPDRLRAAAAYLERTKT